MNVLNPKKIQIWNQIKTLKTCNIRVVWTVKKILQDLRSLQRAERGKAVRLSTRKNSCQRSDQSPAWRRNVYPRIWQENKKKNELENFVERCIFYYLGLMPSVTPSKWWLAPFLGGRRRFHLLKPNLGIFYCNFNLFLLASIWSTWRTKRCLLVCFAKGIDGRFRSYSRTSSAIPPGEQPSRHIVTRPWQYICERTFLAIQFVYSSLIL